MYGGHLHVYRSGGEERFHRAKHRLMPRYQWIMRPNLTAPGIAIELCVYPPAREIADRQFTDPPPPNSVARILRAPSTQLASLGNCNIVNDYAILVDPAGSSHETFDLWRSGSSSSGRKSKNLSSYSGFPKVPEISFVMQGVPSAGQVF